MMNSVFMFEIFLMFGFFMFLMVSNHFLMCLLFLEMLSMVLFFFILNMSFEGEGSVLILFLCVMVLEGAFGLSLLVSDSRKYGGDFLSFLKI